MASIAKRNGRYHVRVRKNGFPIQCRSFTGKRDALRWAADAERAAENGQLLLDDCSVGELLDRYRQEISSKKRGGNVEGYRIKTLRRSLLAPIRLSQLKSVHVARYRDDRLKQVSSASVKRELVILSHAISVAMKDWGYNLPNNPCQQIRKPIEGKGRDRRLVDNEYARLLHACRASENPYPRDERRQLSPQPEQKPPKGADRPKNLTTETKVDLAGPQAPPTLLRFA